MKLIYKKMIMNMLGSTTVNTLKFSSIVSWSVVKIKSNKKVLLRERKRHTARCVVSTPRGTPPRPDLAGGTLPGGVPYLGTPRPDLAGGVPCRGGTPLAGYPHSPAGYPPCTWQGTPPGVCLMAFWKMLQSIMGYGYPSP